MADNPFLSNPLLGALLNAQAQIIRMQEPFWKQMTEILVAPGGGEAVANVDVIWEHARKQGEDWLSGIRAKTGFGGAEGEGIAGETLKRMLDPGQFLYAGSDEINQTIQKLVEGPEFADIGTLERQALRATREWLTLREAGAEYRLITAKAWTTAFERFAKEVGTDPGQLSAGPRALTDRWLAIANAELMATQRTDEFLAAQRKLLRAGVEYRIRERAMIEVWCETHSIPTRTEVDDLHKTVHLMRREMRELRKKVAALSAPEPAPKIAPEPAPRVAQEPAPKPAPRQRKPAVRAEKA